MNNERGPLDLELRPSFCVLKSDNFSFFTALSLESRTPALLSPFGAVKYVIFQIRCKSTAFF